MARNSGVSHVMESSNLSPFRVTTAAGMSWFNALHRASSIVLHVVRMNTSLSGHFLRAAHYAFCAGSFTSYRYVREISKVLAMAVRSEPDIDTPIWIHNSILHNLVALILLVSIAFSSHAEYAIRSYSWGPRSQLARYVCVFLRKGARFVRNTLKSRFGMVAACWARRPVLDM